MNKIAQLKKHGSLVLAEKVLKAVNRLLKTHPLEGEYATVECFENCREQGFHIKVVKNWSSHTNNEDRIVDIARQRNSDDIAVYAYNGDEESFGNCMKDEAWERDGVQNYFRYNEVDKAAKFIYKHLSGK